MGKRQLLFVVVGMLVLPGLAAASPRRWRPLRRLAAPARAEAVVPHTVSPAPRTAQPYWSPVPELYPQWYGGFHGRMLQNYGYPPGDLGLRGTAW